MKKIVGKKKAPKKAEKPVTITGNELYSLRRADELINQARQEMDLLLLGKSQLLTNIFNKYGVPPTSSLDMSTGTIGAK